MIFSSFNLFAADLKEEINDNNLFDLINDTSLYILFFDVDQADAAFIITPEKKYFLIDAGNWGAGEFVIAPILKKLNINTIDKFFISHPHGDHHGGAYYLLSNFNVKELIDAGIITTAEKYKEILDLCISKKIGYSVPLSNSVVYEEPDLEIICLQNNEKYLHDLGLNESSMILMLKYKNFKAIFTGDVETEGEHYLLNHTIHNIEADIIKVPHHGSITSSTDDFINAVKPKVGVISIGYRNYFNHPSAKTIKRYKEIGTKIYRTDYNGHILIKTDGDSFSVIYQLKDRYKTKEIKNVLEETSKLIWQEKKYGEAIKVLNSIYDSAPENPEINSRLGYALYCDSQFTEAEKYLLKAIELNPQDFYARINISKIYELNNLPEKAIKYLEEAVKLERHGRKMEDLYKKIEELKERLSK
ncbi:MAG TPA: MBL fold metallo-hydrolase [bacterium]|nr:MBL fold metallo-hydrolase [bacterium]HPQ18894.1 MBL fold metallo-hydrolase [bacterium]